MFIIRNLIKFPGKSDEMSYLFRAEIDATRKECQEFMDKMKTDETEKQRLEEEQIREQKTKLIIDQVAVSFYNT